MPGRGRFAGVVAAALIVAAVVAGVGRGQVPGGSDAAALEAAYAQAFQAMLADPANLDKAFAFAELAVRMGDLEGAIGTLERMLFINPNLPRVRLELGVLYFRLDSYETARAYIQSAVAAPDVPAVVRQRAETFLAEIDQRLKPHRLSGSLFAGARYQSNANSGPGGVGVRVGGVAAALDDRFTAKSDRNLFAAGSLRHVFDFQSQGGELLDSTANFYAARQDDQKRVDVDVVTLTSGPRLGVPGGLWPQASVRPHLLLDYVALDGSRFFWAPGVGLAVSGPLRPGIGLDLALEGRDRRYRDSADRPFNSQQDGWVTSAQADLAHAPFRFLQVTGTARFANQQAREGSEANNESAFGGGVSLAVPSPLAIAGSPWVLSLSAVRAFTNYELPDPDIDPGVTRRDRDWRYNFVASVPFGDSFGVVATLGRFERQSSLPNFVYRNRYASLGLSWRF